MQNRFSLAALRWLLLYIAIFVAIVGLLGTYYLHATHIAQKPLAVVHVEAENFDAEEAYWQDRITVVGGSAAYTEFLQFVQGKSAEKEHTLAHAFGDALYKVEGESGISVCDGSASYGCFHAIMGNAVAEHGIGEVDSLITFCKSVGIYSCQHGVGHGIMVYFGYTKEALTKALAVCKAHAVPDPMDSCYSGVFMEYNMRTMRADDSTPRPADDDLLAPCNFVDTPYQRSCAHEQARWWVQAVFEDIKPDATLYAKLGALCDQLGTNATTTRACYEGLGEVMPQTVAYNPETAAMLCKASSSSKLHSLFCLSHAAGEITDSRGDTEGLKTCAALAGGALQFCNAYATKVGNILNAIAAPTTL